MRRVIERIVGKRPKPDSAVPRNFSLDSGERQTGTALHEIRVDHRYRYEKAIEILKSRVHGTTSLFGIDAFCANGYGCLMLSSALDCFVHGVDASEEAIAQANRHFSTDKTFFSCKEFPFQLPEAIFDFVTCIESVEHVSQYELLLEVLAKSLRKGGLFFVSTPNEDVMPFDQAEMPFHVKHFKNQELIDLLTKKGTLDLITSFGQNVYNYENGFRGDLVEEASMQLREGNPGQFQIYVCEKS